jgi:predicted molibdopterin-dependent oxidoreductase YjgC
VRNERVTFTFDDVPMDAQRGQTVAAALIAGGVSSWRVTRSGRRRGLFCGIGACFDCLVDVNDDRAVRACLIPVHDGDRVRTSDSQGPVELGPSEASPPESEPAGRKPGA